MCSCLASAARRSTSRSCSARTASSSAFTKGWTMKKKATTTSPRRVLSSDACPVCGTHMKEKRGKLAFPVNGEDVRVPDATHLACPKGHDPVLRADDARRL